MYRKSHGLGHCSVVEHLLSMYEAPTPTLQKGTFKISLVDVLKMESITNNMINIIKRLLQI
jgi:hypothetical protein